MWLRASTKLDVATAASWSRTPAGAAWMHRVGLAAGDPCGDPVGLVGSRRAGQAGGDAVGDLVGEDRAEHRDAGGDARPGGTSS